MEQVFDLREFLVMIFKKIRFFLIAAVIFAILGAAFGLTRSGEDVYNVSASASVNLVQNKLTDASALQSIMSSIKETVSGDYYYNGAYFIVKEELGAEDCARFFGEAEEPSISSLKSKIKLYVNGNLLLTDALSTDRDLAARVCDAIINNCSAQLSSNINGITIERQGTQINNKTQQEGTSKAETVIKFAIIGFLAGIVLALIWVFFFDVMSLKINSANDLKRYNLPILGEIEPTKGDK